MEFDPFLLARLQFAANISFHILFPTITIGLCWVLFYFRLRYTFSGDNLKATLETGDVQPANGRRSAINRVRPLTDAGTFTAQIGSKATTAATETFTTASSPTADGTCPTRTQGRYHRFKVEIPAATTWSEAVGVEFEAAPLGGR